ncbi:MAG: helix-turn-helix domain-containing protein [Spirochaetota bacterium]
MSRVLLITKNTQLADYCRRLVPEGFSLNHSGKLNLRKETTQGILLFDSALLVESSDTVVAAAAEQLGAAHGAVVIGLLMNEDNRAQAFSLFPENLRHVQAVLPYRFVAGKVQGFGAAELRWFLEIQQRTLRLTGEKLLTQNENRLLARRLARFETEAPSSHGYPAFMQGRSQSIVRFREQVLHAAAHLPFVFVPGRDEAPADDFLEYYCALIRPQKRAVYEVIDLEKTPPSLHMQAIWPQKKKQKKSAESQPVVCIRNLQRLGWANQAQLLQSLRAAQAEKDADRRRFVLFATHEIGQLVRRGTFRQELYSLMRKGVAELPPLYERAEDITHIAAEYISQRKYTPLMDEKSAIAARILEKFDISAGYRGLFMTLDLLHDLQKSKGIPVFELLGKTEKSEAFAAARSFLREEIEPSAESLFQNLAGGEKDALSLELVERHYIAAVCERYAWQVTDAARHLGISRKTLYDKMRRYKLARPEKGGSDRQRAS